jgi:hypothetical protein
MSSCAASFAPAPERFRAHPQLRLPGQPQTCHHLATFLPTARRGTANRATGFHRRSQRSLVLPQVWWTDDGRRNTHRCRNPTSFPTGSRGCGMKRLSSIRKCFSHRSLPLCLASERTSFSSSSTTLFTILFRIQLASGLILSRVALCGTASAQLDDAPSHH